MKLLAVFSHIKIIFICEKMANNIFIIYVVRIPIPRFCLAWTCVLKFSTNKRLMKTKKQSVKGELRVLGILACMSHNVR